MTNTNKNIKQGWSPQGALNALTFDRNNAVKNYGEDSDRVKYFDGLIKKLFDGKLETVDYTKA